MPLLSVCFSQGFLASTFQTGSYYHSKGSISAQIMSISNEAASPPKHQGSDTPGPVSYFRCGPCTKNTHSTSLDDSEHVLFMVPVRASGIQTFFRRGKLFLFALIASMHCSPTLTFRAPRAASRGIGLILLRETRGNLSHLNLRPSQPQ